MGTPDWWRSAVVYHVYVRSFQDSDGDGVGDLRGVMQRLDYLNDGTDRSLGIDALWLSPICRSANRDWGYDVLDYEAVEPVLGDLEAFDALLEACHERGIRLLLDFVPNHTSDQHPWFVEARASRMSARRDWYVWRDPGPDGGPPNNWHSAFRGPAWTLDEHTGQYYLHTFLPQQPDLNWRNPAVREALADAMRFWLRRGVDGFRLDAIGRLAKHPQLLDNPPNPTYEPGSSEPEQLSEHNQLHDDLIEAARAIRRVLDEFPGRVGLGEVWSTPARRALLYAPPELDGIQLVFDFQLVRPGPFGAYVPWTADAIEGALASVERDLPPGAQPAFAFANHDVPRFIERHGADGYGVERARASVLLLLGLRGTPCIYYGEEIGMRSPGRAYDALDPVGRDDARTPMQWDRSAGRGFTTGEPWLPFGALEIDVASQDGDPASMLSLHRRAIHLRRAEAALHSGALEALRAGDDVVSFVRTAPGARPVFVAVNCAREERRLPLPDAFHDLLLASIPGVDVREGALRLPPLASAWVTG